MTRVDFVLGAAAILLIAPLARAENKVLWSIYWLSDKLPCDGYWGKPMTAAALPCPPIENIAISICPQPSQSEYPYDHSKPITIIDYEITQILSVPTANGYMVVGSGHGADGRGRGGDGADVFAMTGGVGTNSKALMFPSGVGLPQGTTPRVIDSNYAHIDVYGYCDSGTQQALVNILYTSP